MIWRSTLVLFTSLAALNVAVDTLRAETNSGALLLAQSPVVDPNTAVDTGQAVPDLNGAVRNSPLGNVASEEQIAEIKVLQQKLKNRGYYNGPIDGIYGPGTEAALRALRGQTDSGAVSGTVPNATLPQSQPPPLDTAAPQTAPAENAPEVSDSVDTPPSDDPGVAIGDEVSPETGVDSTEPEEETTDTASDSDADADGAVAPTAGPGSMMWVGLALVAALGSFGIGFVLVNRGSASEEDTDSPWGTVPDEVPNQSGAEPLGSLPLNGHGTHSAQAPQGGVIIETPKEQQLSQSPLPMVPVANTTTRLAQVDVIDELVSNLQVADPAKRRKAIWELGQRGNSSAVQHLVNGMVDADSKEKSLILAALSEIGIRSLKPMSRALAIALQDENPDVRKNAIRDLTRVYDLVTQISQMLGHATEDEDPEVRRTAEWALGQLSRIREAPKIKASMNGTKALDGSHTPSELLPEDMENLKN